MSAEGTQLIARLVRTDSDKVYANQALEEAIFRKLKGPTVRVWTSGPSVVLGRAQLAWAETDLDLCRERKVTVVRRFTAGGAVYNGPGNLNWSFFLPSGSNGEHVRYSREIGRVFEGASEVIGSALGKCGVKAYFGPPNGIMTVDGKVSGMAAYVSKEGLVCHGTLLMQADLELVAKLTTPSQAKLERKYVRSRAVKVANAVVGKKEFVDALLTSVEADGYRVEEGECYSEEMEASNKLLAEKYSKDSWNLGDPFAVARGT
jgi:lipoate-protein ligase A